MSFYKVLTDKVAIFQRCFNLFLLPPQAVLKILLFMTGYVAHKNIFLFQTTFDPC